MRSRTLILLAAFALIACAAHAVTVTVTPIDGNLCTYDWSIEAFNLGTAEICSWGPSTYNNPGNPFVAGRGAFYATCDRTKGTAPLATGDYSPSNCWLGVGEWNGQSLEGRTLGSITALDYYSFVESQPQRFGDGNMPLDEPEEWTKTSWWRYVAQPIILELTVEHPTDPSERRQFWYRAWGGNYAGDDYPKAHIEQWEHLNCLTYGKWYTPRSDDVVAKPNAEEFGCPSWTYLLNTSLSDLFPGTPTMPPFREWKLVATNLAYKGAGWNKKTVPWGTPHTNGTGKAINFHVGARTSMVRPLWLQGTGLTILWPNQTYDFHGQVDKFTLGFDGTSITYDFEPPAGQSSEHLSMTTAKSLEAPIMAEGNTKNQNLFKVAGYVTRIKNGDNINDFFLIEDGSNLKYEERWIDPVSQLWVSETRDAPVWVFLDPVEAGDVRVGDYVSAWGYPQRMRFHTPYTPIIMWTSVDKVRNLSFTP